MFRHTRPILKTVVQLIAHSKLSVAPTTALRPFEDVYQECSDRVYRFCLWQSRNPSLAEDIAAETFLRAYSAYERTRPEPETVHVWLFRIARNLCISHRRRESRWAKLMNRLHQPEEVDVEALAGVNADVARVLRVLGSMKERDRQLISFHIAGGLSFLEIGSLLGMSEKNASVATSRALARIRNLSEAES